MIIGKKSKGFFLNGDKVDLLLFPELILYHQKLSPYYEPCYDIMSLLPKKPMAIELENTLSLIRSHHIEVANRSKRQNPGESLTHFFDQPPRGPSEELIEPILRSSTEATPRENRPSGNPLLVEEPEVRREEEAKRVFTTKEAAERVGVHPKTLLNYAKEEGFGYQPEPGTPWSFSSEDIELAIGTRQKRKEERQKKLKAVPKPLRYNQSVVEQLVSQLADQPETFGLKEAAALVAEAGQDLEEIDIPPGFYSTFSRWALLALDKAVEENNPNIFSPTAFACRRGDTYAYGFTTSDIRAILSLSPSLYPKEESFEEKFKAARERLAERRQANVGLNQAAEELLGGSSYYKRKKLEAMLAEGDLSLSDDYPFLFANTIGIPPDVYEKLKPVWQQELEAVQEKQREALHPRRRLALGRLEGKLHCMGSLFQEIFGLERKSVYTKLAAFYLARRLEPFGIKVELVPHPHGASYYCFTDTDNAARLRALRQDYPEEWEQTKTILENGFQALEEYQQYCPPDYLISLTDCLKVLGVPMNGPNIGANIETLKALFSSFGLEVQEVKHGERKKSYYLPLDDFGESFEDLAGSQELGETLRGLEVKPEEELAFSTLLKKGRLTSLTSLLKKAGFERINLRRVGKVAEFLNDKITIYRFRSGYQLRKENEAHNLQVVNQYREKVEELLLEPKQN